MNICSVESAWVSGLHGVAIAWLSAQDHTTLSSVIEAKRRVAGTTLAYPDTLTDTELNAEISRLPAQWIGPPRSPAIIILHILAHALHHKGQLAAMFRLLGHPAPDTDLQREG